MTEIKEAGIGDRKENFNREIYRLLLFYGQLTELLETCFSGCLTIITNESNRNYLRLCNKVKGILEEPGFEDLALHNWQPFNNLRFLDPDVPNAEWEYAGQQVCGDFLSAIEQVFISAGEKTYPLDRQDQQLLNSVKTYLQEYSSFKRERENRWLQEIQKQAEEWKKKQGKPQVETPQFDFEFVKDNEIKKLLANDWGEAQKAIQNGLHKSTVVLCGAILESLLIDALSRIKSTAKLSYYQKYIQGKRKGGKPPQIERWQFYQLVEIAEEQGIISPNVAELSCIVRDYRNLIHLWVQKRKGLRIDPIVAPSVVGFLTIAYSDIREWHTHLPKTI